MLWARVRLALWRLGGGDLSHVIDLLAVPTGLLALLLCGTECLWLLIIPLGLSTLLRAILLVRGEWPDE